MLESYVTVLAFILFPLSLLMAVAKAYISYRDSRGSTMIIGNGNTNLIGILSFAWLVVRFSAYIKVILLWTLFGVVMLVGLFLISYFVALVFEHINKTNRMKERMLKDRKN